MNNFKNRDGQIIVLDMIKAIQTNKDYLSEIDGAIGDGDHGINMNKGFTLCEAALMGKQCGFGESLCVLGDVLFNEIGGSMGPIYGVFFTEMGNSLAGAEEIDAEMFGNSLANAIAALQEIVTAKVGDKTLIDVLAPASDAFAKAIGGHKSFSESLDEMKTAATNGRDATRNMVAKLGRASRLGERSIGVIDAGAASSSILLAAMADGIKGLLA